ncbi:MAG TPA: D-glycero-beta-D-manno-heptose 1,7-bisphosphate 7-phosphatase [Burkholderiaceae bacterium]|nr:D-glycero-beta-D-manno-heptose 1,7-bisphosphate 7-phosphatase [Burkholderiaceae bacterium]
MKLIILDRDGVINHDSDAYIKSAEEWHAIAGSPEAIGRLTRAGWRVVVATNQSGVARGLFSAQELNRIHGKMRQEVAAAGGRIDAIFACPHHPDDACPCRKPRPGMFHDIARRYDQPLAGVPAIGDSLRDLHASTETGCQPWLVLTGNGLRARQHPDLPPDTQIRSNLAAVVDSLLTGDA